MDSMKKNLILKLSLAAFVGLAVTVQGDWDDPSQKPDGNRFTIVPVTEPNALNEPMAFEVLDDGKAFIIERRGAVKLFDPGVQAVKPVGMLAVNNATRNGNGEQGLVGMTLDPKFADNGWMYLYYQHPVEEKSILSRWEVRDDVLVANSEMVMLEWPAQRETCCHTGGGMAWDEDGNLFLTVGNNRGNNQTSHTDEREGRSAWDDQGGASNSNSLEGKILRIHPEPDGSYTIPEGNLFPPGTPNTRPETYTMGHRNAWRVSVDSETGYIYWGEVGPDVRQASDRAPLSYDEFNQARGPGYFGWPYFIGDSAYPVWDYVADAARPVLDPNHPVNNSPNNTGIKELPPMAPTFIYYPYGESEKYPALGSGGRSATGGPIYHRSDFADPVRPWPAYFEGKWITTDFSRRLIVLIEMDENGDFVSMERFLPDYNPVEPIDMKFGPDGNLYVLEYGGRWFQASPEARLTRIEFEGGNRKPIVVASADKVGGIPPFQVQLSAEGTEDYDGDALKYEWQVVDIGGNQRVFKEPDPTVTLEGIGTYVARLTVTDPSGASASQSVNVVSGNEPPKVSVRIDGNESFFFPDNPFGYAVEVEDREDGKLSEGQIAKEKVALSISYAAADFDVDALRNMAPGDAALARFPVAQSLLDGKANCRSCHLPNTRLVGPSFADVAQKYLGDSGARANLAQKIMTGGSGVWGELAMPPNPTVNESEAASIVDYVLSLAGDGAEPLAVAGEFTPTIPENTDSSGKFIVRASYTDNGDEGAAPLSGQAIYVLRSSELGVSGADVNQGVVAGRFGASVAPNAHLGFKQVDLTGVRSLDLTAAAYTFGDQKGGTIEIRLGSPTGDLIGSLDIEVQQPNFGRRRPAPPADADAPRPEGTANATSVDDAPAPPPRRTRRRFGPEPKTIAIKPSPGIQDMYLVFKNSDAADDDTLMSFTSVKFNVAQTALR